MCFLCYKYAGDEVCGYLCCCGGVCPRAAWHLCRAHCSVTLFLISLVSLSFSQASEKLQIQLQLEAV